MSLGQLQDFTIASLQEGRDQFTEIHASIKNLSDLMEENTKITRETAATCKQQGEDTADLVRIYKFGKSGASIIKASAEGGSNLIRILIPWALLAGVVLAWWHGDRISIKDILEAMK